MKTKLTLFVAVFAVALFGVGCASTQKTYAISTLVQKDGKWQQESGELVTGKVVNHLNGQLLVEFHLKGGLKHGEGKNWHVWSKAGKFEFSHGYHIANVNVWENGKLIRHKQFWYQGGQPYWTGTRWQLIMGGWNQDGTPAEHGQEKAIKK